MRKTTTAAVVTALLLSGSVLAAPPAEAASVLVYGARCSPDQLTPKNPDTVPVYAYVTRFNKTGNDNVYIDILARTDVPLRSVRLNGKSAKFRYVHPAPKAGGTNSPNVVSSSWAGNIEVTWYDYRAGKRGRIVECRFTRVA